MISDQNEMDNIIFKNILTIIKIMKCIYKRLCDNYFLTKEEIDLLLYTLKFVDTMNLFMNKQSIEQISGLIYEINEIIFSIHNFEDKDMILKKIRYTEMTIIYFKKKYFKTLFFGDGKILGSEIEKCLELVTINGTFDQKTFKQMQNIFYVVQGKIEEKYRYEIQTKMNDLKALSLKHKSEKFSINDDYKDYVNSKNFSNDDYYENFNENNLNNIMSSQSLVNTGSNSNTNVISNNTYSYYGNNKGYDNSNFYNNNYENFYYNGKKSNVGNIKPGNFKNKYYGNQNVNKANTYLVELPENDVNKVHSSNTVAMEHPNNEATNEIKSNSEKQSKEVEVNISASAAANYIYANNNQHLIPEEKANTINDSHTNISNIAKEPTTENYQAESTPTKYEVHNRSNSYGNRKIQNYYNDNFFKNYVYYYEKPVSGVSNKKESYISNNTTNPNLNSSSLDVIPITNNSNTSTTQNVNSNVQTESPAATNSNANSYNNHNPVSNVQTNNTNFTNTATPVKSNNADKQNKNKYKRNKNTTFEQVIYSDNNNYTNSHKSSIASASNSSVTKKAEALNEDIATTVEIPQTQKIREVEIEEKTAEVVEPMPQSDASYTQSQSSPIQVEITSIQSSNPNFNKKVYNNNYNYKNSNYKNYNMAYSNSNNYNYMNYNYNNSTHYSKNNYYNNSNINAASYDYNYSNYTGSNKTYKNEVESTYNNPNSNSNYKINTSGNKEGNSNISSFNSHMQNYNYNYSNSANYKKNSLNNNTNAQHYNYYQNNFKNARVKTNPYPSKYKSNYDYNKKYDNNSQYVGIDSTKQETSESAERKESVSNEEQNYRNEMKLNNDSRERAELIQNEVLRQTDNEDPNEKERTLEENIKKEQEQIPEDKLDEQPCYNENCNSHLQAPEIKDEKATVSNEIKTKNNIEIKMPETTNQEIAHSQFNSLLFSSGDNRQKMDLTSQDNPNSHKNKKEFVDVDVEKMFASDNPRNIDSDAYNDDNYHQYEEEELGSVEEEFEENDDEMDEEEDEEIQNIIDNEIEQLNARDAENELLNEEDDGDSDSNDNEIIEAEYDKFMIESKMAIPNNINYKMNINNDYTSETKNNKIIFEDDEIPSSSDNLKKENANEARNEEVPLRKSSENLKNEKDSEQIRRVSENVNTDNTNIMQSQSEEKNLKETTKNFMDSLKNIDPKLLMEIKNKINENNKERENDKPQVNVINQNQFAMQPSIFQNPTAPNYNPTHINPLNLEASSQQQANQNQLSYEDYIKQQQMTFAGLNNKVHPQNFIFTNYSHFFYRGRDSNIHREYFALKCLEQENSSLISNNLEAFEKKILVPIYQRINFNVNKKKGIYLYTFTKYKKLIYRVLSKEKILKKVKPYGSYMNNFLIDSGDIDICIVPKCSILEFSNSLEKIKEEITTNNFGEHKLTHHNSRYMLLKIVDHQTKFVIDITVHNMLPILNTNLIRLYSLYDQRFHILGLYIKHWSKMNKIHGAADNYLSSYAMLLMLIYFLQNVVDPKVLPNLQNVEKKESIYEYNQNGEMIKTNIYYEEDVQKIKNYLSTSNSGRENKESATQLLLKFFEYYSYYFDYYEQKIAIHKSPNELVKKTHDNIAYSIEDPFDPYHNPGKSMLINSNQFYKFITAMKKEINFIMNGEYIKRLEKMNTCSS